MFKSRKPRNIPVAELSTTKRLKTKKGMTPAKMSLLNQKEFEKQLVEQAEKEEKNKLFQERDKFINELKTIQNEYQNFISTYKVEGDDLSEAHRLENEYLDKIKTYENQINKMNENINNINTFSDDTKKKLKQQTTLKDEELNKPIKQIIKNIVYEIKKIENMNVDTIDNMIVQQVREMDIQNAINVNVDNIKSIKADLSKMKEIQLDKKTIEQLIEAIREEMTKKNDEVKNQLKLLDESLKEIANFSSSEVGLLEDVANTLNNQGKFNEEEFKKIEEKYNVDLTGMKTLIEQINNAIGNIGTLSINQTGTLKHLTDLVKQVLNGTLSINQANNIILNLINSISSDVDKSLDNIIDILDYSHEELLKTIKKQPSKTMSLLNDVLNEISTTVNEISNKPDLKLDDLDINIAGYQPLYEYITENINQLKDSLMVKNQELKNEIEKAQTPKELQAITKDKFEQELQANKEEIKEYIMNKLNSFKNDINQAIKTNNPQDVIKMLEQRQTNTAIDNEIKNINNILKQLTNPKYPVYYYITQHPSLPEETIEKIHNKVKSSMSVEYDKFVKLIIDELINNNLIKDETINIDDILLALKEFNNLCQQQNRGQIHVNVSPDKITVGYKTSKTPLEFKNYGLSKDLIKKLFNDNGVSTTKLIEYNSKGIEQINESTGLIRENLDINIKREIDKIKKDIEQLKMIIFKQHKQINTIKTDTLEQIKHFDKSLLNKAPKEPEKQIEKNEPSDLQKLMEKRRKDIEPDEPDYTDDNDEWADGIMSDMIKTYETYFN